MRASVHINGTLAAVLEKDGQGKYRFQYELAYLGRRDAYPISLTLPLQEAPVASDHLFPFFAGLLSEGVNKDIQCRLLRIDEDDEFSRLLATAGDDTIGAVTIKKLDS